MEKDKKSNQKGKEQKVQLSEREIKLRKQFDELRKLAKKYGVKPFDRKQIYGTY